MVYTNGGFQVACIVNFPVVFIKAVLWYSGFIVTVQVKFAYDKRPLDYLRHYYSAYAACMPVYARLVQV